MRNLRFVLEDLNDRGRAVEPNRLSPTGAGFTGLEAFLQYFFVQSQAINVFDSKGYLLKLNILVNDCSKYTNAETAATDTQHTAKCKQWLGPTQPGDHGRGRPHDARRSPPAAARTARRTRRRLTAPRRRAPAARRPPARPPSLLPDPGDLLDDVLPKVGPKLPPLLPRAGGRASADSERSLLDFLLGP